MKRIIALVLTLMMVFSLTGCQKKANYTTDKLNVWIWDESQRETLEALAAPWAEKTHIEVEIIAKSQQEYWQDVKTGLLPDLMWVDDEHLNQLVQSDTLLQLEEQVAGSKALGMKDFPDQLQALFQTGGHTYAVPREGQVAALWYNQALFDSMHLAYPDENWTWDQVAAAAAKLTNRHNGVYGIVIPTDQMGDGWYNLVYAWGGGILGQDENGAAVSRWQDEETVAAMKLLASMIADAMPSQHTMDALGAEQLFASGDAGMVLLNRADAEKLLNSTGSNKWACTMLPYCDLDGSEDCGEGERVAVLEGSGWAISAKSTDINASFDLLEILGGSSARKALAPEATETETAPDAKEDGQTEETPEPASPLAVYDRMMTEAKLIPMPRQGAGENWEEYAVAETMYTAWNDPSRMEAMLREQHSFTQTQLDSRESNQPTETDTEQTPKTKKI